MRAAFDTLIRALLHVAAAGVAYPLGLLAMKVKNWDVARERFRWVIDHCPGHYAAHVRLGWVCFELGLLDEAQQVLEQAHRISPLRSSRLDDSAFTDRGSGDHAAEECGTAWETDSSSFRTQPSPAAHWKPEASSDLRHDTDQRATAFRYRDFSSLEEVARFRNRPPISQDELARVNWKQLLDQIQGE